MALTVTEIDALRGPIESTWSSIYADVDHSYMVDNLHRIEMVLDSDRLHYAGFPEANAAVRELCRVHGWNTVYGQLSDVIRLAQ